jgi:hypothetical protein
VNETRKLDSLRYGFPITQFQSNGLLRRKQSGGEGMRLPQKVLIVTILASLTGAISAAQTTQDARELAPGAGA